MARLFTQAAFGLLLLLLNVHKALAYATSTTTAYVVVTTTTSRDSYADATSTITTTRTVKSYYTPTSQHPIATSTYTNSLLDLEVVQLYLAPGSIEAYKLVDDMGFGLHPGGDGGTSTYWIAPVTYTAPTSCPTPFTVKTTATVSVAASQTADLHPTSTNTYSGVWGPAVTFYLSAAPPGPAPTSTWDYEHYIAKCREPPSSSSSGSGSGLDPDTEICVRRSLCMTWNNWIIVLATVLPGLFVLGFVESFFWFRQLMRGRRAMRLGTLCWTLCSGWVLCFTRVTPARDLADQPALCAQWKAMSVGEKWRLWWKWGFRHRYPVDLLGPDPRKQIAGAVPAAKVEDMEEGVQGQPQGQQQGQQQAH